MEERTEEQSLVAPNGNASGPGRREQAQSTIRSHVLWALGAGLMPIPMTDIVAVTAVQLSMLRNLARIYEVDFTKETAKAFVSALTGGTLARLGASAVKAIPGVGTIIGGVSMSALSGASTYAVGQVAVQYLEEGSSFLQVDMDRAKKAYEEALERGKEFVSDLEGSKGEARDVSEKIRHLAQLKEDGVLSEEEFEAKKRELLSRL